ncbi:MAG TPA: hypothetical protein VHQ41_04120 [Patescibacteria group bacterium]|jgi:hypothetical protein|nr:hypothetical protein [Patescibacteria group bacterium]
MKKLFMLFLVIASFAFATTVLADTVGTNFENFATGSPNGQFGWMSTGSAGSGCAPYDHKITSNGVTAPASFGTKSLRISNAFVSGCFGDQTFSASVLNEAGETSAVSNGMSGGVRQPYYTGQFSLASMLAAQQAGLYMSVSPDRGDGARMSYLRFEDLADGIHVFFDEYKDVAPFGASIGDANGCGVGDDFTDVDIATLDRSVPHTIKFAMNFVDGAGNDVVKIYIDGVLKTTGTSWEDYFRYCEGNPTRPVDSILFRTGGNVGVISTLGNGFLVDDVSVMSGPTPPPVATNKDQCKNGGWANVVRADGSGFKNQGDCVSYTNNGK